MWSLKEEKKHCDFACLKGATRIHFPTQTTQNRPNARSVHTNPKPPKNIDPQKTQQPTTHSKTSYQHEPKTNGRCPVQHHPVSATPPWSSPASLRNHLDLPASNPFRTSLTSWDPPKTHLAAASSSYTPTKWRTEKFKKKHFD